MPAPTATRASWTFDAIGTSWAIETAAPLPPVARDAVAAVVERFDLEWSRFRDDSLVSALAAGRVASVPLPEDADAMLSLYDELDAATGGAVNPLVGDALARLGYDARVTWRRAGSRVRLPRGARRCAGTARSRSRRPRRSTSARSERGGWSIGCSTSSPPARRAM